MSTQTAIVQTALLFITILAQPSRSKGDDELGQRQQAVSPEEHKLYALFKNDVNLGVVGAEAEALLSRNPGSYVAHLVLGLKYSKEGLYPKAVHQLRQARMIIEKQKGYNALPGGNEPQWHACIIYSLALTYHAMDRIAEELAMIDVFDGNAYGSHADKLNFPSDSTLRRINALLVSGRVDEAEQILESNRRNGSILKQDIDAISAKLLFARQPDGMATYKALSGSYADETRFSDQFAEGMLAELGFHAMRQNQYRQAILFQTGATQVNNGFSAFHPYNELAAIHTLAGNWNLARESLSKCWEWIRGKRQDIQQYLFKNTHLALAQFYIACGYPDRARMILIPLENKPARTGFTTRSMEQWEAGFYLTMLSASRQSRALADEIMASRPLAARWVYRAKQVPRLLQEMTLARKLETRIGRQLNERDDFRDAFVLVFSPNWLWGEAIQTLDPHLSTRLFDTFPLKGEQARFDKAVRTEIAFAESNFADVVKSGIRALEDIPPWEVVWRARLNGMLAEAKSREPGGMVAAVPYYEQALRLDPAIFRQLDIRIPTVISTSGDDPLLQEIAQCLRSSPRFKARKDALTLKLSISDKSVSWAFIGMTQIKSGICSLPKDTPINMMASECSRLLHRMIFSPLEEVLAETDFNKMEWQTPQPRVKQGGNLAELMTQGGQQSD